MSENLPSPLAASAGLLGGAAFLAGSAIIGAGPDFSASGSEVADFYADSRTRIQVGSAFLAAAVPLVLCYLATVAALAAARGPALHQAGVLLFGSGLAFVMLFMADVTTLVVGALHPEEIGAGTARALRDFEFLAMGIAAPSAAAMLAAAAYLCLRHGAVWPRWFGILSAVCAPLYLLRLGTLFTDEGLFAADGLLGILVPVGAMLVWLTVGSAVLAAQLRQGRLDRVAP